MRGVEQRARQHGQAVAQAGGGFGVAGALDRLGVQRKEDAAQPRVFAHQQRFDAAVLEKLDRHALEGAPVVGDLRLAPAPVADHVGEYGAIAVKTRDAAGIVEHVWHTHAELVVVRDRLAQFVEGGGIGHQQIIVTPQGAQIKVELPFNVGEQRTVAFALEHRTAVGRLQFEIIDLPFRMIAVVADAVFHPVPQAGHRQQLDQKRRLRKEFGQAGAGEGGVVAVDGSAGTDHQVLRDIGVELQLFG